MLCFVSTFFWGFFYVGVRVYHKSLLGGILSVSQTPEWFCRWEHVTKAYIEIEIRSQWVKFQFLMNYLFKRKIRHSYTPATAALLQHTSVDLNEKRGKCTFVTGFLLFPLPSLFSGRCSLMGKHIQREFILRNNVCTSIQYRNPSRFEQRSSNWN